MSKYLSTRFQGMKPYRLGEQPTDKKYIKLNSNETSIQPSPLVMKAIKDALQRPLGFYSDQDAMVLREELARTYQVLPSQVFVGNGADEILSYCFTAYGEASGFAFPDITYGFYKTYLDAFKMEYEEIPLREDFTIDLEPYKKTIRNIVIANPNAPTGLRLSVDDIEDLLSSNKERIVIIDEAYVDFGTQSCISKIGQYPNLIVVHTMSKSRNMAGLHVGYAIANQDMIEELNCLKNCFNPNNLNKVTLDAAVAAVLDQDFLEKSCEQKIEVRQQVMEALVEMGFEIIPSHTNFVFFTHPLIKAADLEIMLRNKAVLLRHYGQERIVNYLRMTIGTQEEMNTVIAVMREILSERFDKRYA